MFTCIACTKQTTDEREEEEEGGRDSGTPSTKEAVKGLTAQLKDIFIKQCKPCTGSPSYKKGQRPFPDFDTISEGVPYPYIGGGASSSSTPAWDFTSSRYPGGRSDPRFGGAARDSTVSAQSCDVVLEEEDEPKEWMAQVEPGVHITFVSLPNGGNDLKRIRFSREMFNKWQAQRWWGENYDRIMELYNVQRFNRQAFQTPSRADDEPRDSSYTRLGSARESKEWTPRHHYRPSGYRGHYPSDHFDQGVSHQFQAGSSMEPPRPTTDSVNEPSISNAGDMEAEWIEEDEPGVYITIRQLADGTRELRRVRFSRERFGEVNAKTWWEENRERIQEQYL